jgi:hypothetical protein
MKTKGENLKELYELMVEAQKSLGVPDKLIKVDLEYSEEWQIVITEKTNGPVTYVDTSDLHDEGEKWDLLELYIKYCESLMQSDEFIKIKLEMLL